MAWDEERMNGSSTPEYTSQDTLRYLITDEAIMYYEEGMEDYPVYKEYLAPELFGNIIQVPIIGSITGAEYEFIEIDGVRYVKDKFHIISVITKARDEPLPVADNCT